MQGDRTRPGIAEYYILLAEQAAKRSTCSRLQVGAVLVQNNAVIGTGYNGAPRGMPHCVHTDDSPCRISVHAEANALVCASSYQKYWYNQLYLTHAPCYDCSKLIINAGVCAVFYRDTFRTTEGLDLLADAGVSLQQVK